MTQTILVTAATSNVGSEVVRQLANESVKVRAAVRSIDRVGNFPANVELVEFNLNDPDTVRAAFREVDRAFLMTPLVPNLTELDATCTEAAKQAGVKHLVKLSIMGADTETDMLLAQAHRRSEEFIERSGIAYTFLRPNSFFQNYLIYTRASIINDNAIYLPLGSGKLSLVDIRDVATIATVGLTHSGHENQKYLITGSQVFDNSEVADILSDVLGRKINYIDIPEEAARQAMQANQMPDAQVEMVLGLYKAQKAGRYATITPLFRQITGKDTIEFPQFARDYADFFK
jgi:uncharacterized protein YbjT (DUF2867 family)